MGILAEFEVPWDSLFELIAALVMGYFAYRLKAMGAVVEEVHIATNSMKDDLVKATEKEALARGGAQERTRSDLEELHEGQDALADVKTELAKLTAVTDEKVDEVGDQVEEVDDKVEKVHDAVIPKDKGEAK